MTPGLVFILAKIAAVQARVAGMQALNAARPDSYDEGQFYIAETELNALAECALNEKAAT